MRSLLFVARPTSAGIETAMRAGADALILNLEQDDHTTAAQTRDLVRDFLQAVEAEADRPLVYVRIAPIAAGQADADLAVVMMGAPDGLVLGHSESGMHVQQLGAKVAVQEAELGLSDGETAIIAEAGSTAGGLLAMGSYRDASPRLMGLSWDAAALALDLGSASYRNPDLAFADPMLMARSLTLFAARSASVTAIDGPTSDLDARSFEHECETARRIGFNAKIAATSAEVAVINHIFDRSI